MKHYSFLSVALVIFSLLICISPALGKLTLFDGEFNPSDWVDDIYIQDAGTSIPSIITNPIDGNPNANREMTVRFDEGTQGETSYIWLFSRYTPTAYNPSVQGAITRIDYSEDARVAASSASVNINIPSRMGLLQNGTIYRTQTSSTIHSRPWPSSWQSISLDGLVAANFVKHSDGPGPLRPDFSETGGEIYFGYVRGNQHYSTDYEFVIGIDNWSVTVYQASDPACTIDKQVLNNLAEPITTAEVGDTVTYRITLTNSGSVDLTGATVTDTLPANLQYNSATATPANAGITFSAGTVTWPVGTVTTGGSASLDINVTILAGADQQTLTNTARATADGAVAQTASVDLQVVTDATHTINKQVLNGAEEEITNAVVGDTVTYRITLANTGGVDLTGATITDTLPDNLQYNSATATPANAGITYSAGTVTWPVGTVTTGGSASLDISVTVLVGADQQTLTNTAEVTAIDAPADAGQTASANLQVGDTPPTIDVVISDLTIDDDWGIDCDRMDAGEVYLFIYYDLTITNNGINLADGEVALKINTLSVLDMNENLTNYGGIKTIISTGLNCGPNPTDNDINSGSLPKKCTLNSLNTNDTMTARIEIQFWGSDVPNLLIDYDFELVSAPVPPPPEVSYSRVSGRTNVGGTINLPPLWCVPGPGGSTGGGGGGCFIDEIISGAW